MNDEMFAEMKADYKIMQEAILVFGKKWCHVENEDFTPEQNKEMEDLVQKFDKMVEEFDN